jgi:sugar lactone lactonase YvrE
MRSSLPLPTAAARVVAAVARVVGAALCCAGGNACAPGDGDDTDRRPVDDEACPPRVLGPAPSAADRGVLVVLAGEGGAGFVDGVDGRTNGVGGLAPTDDGGLLVTDIFNATLRRVDGDDGAWTTPWGAPLIAGARDGACGDARFNGPRGVARDPRDADVYWFGDGPCLRRLDMGTGAVDTVAGDCTSPGDADGPLAEARFGFLFHDVEVAADGRVFVADRVNDVVRVVDVEAGAVVTLAGGFDGPGALALDDDAGVLYVADTFRCAVMAVDVDDGTTAVIGGLPGRCGERDGDASVATLDDPQALALVGARLLVGGFSGAVRLLDPADGSIATVSSVPAGFFAPFSTLDDGAVVAADTDGALWTLDDAGGVTGRAGPRTPAGFVDGAGVDARFALPATVVALPGPGGAPATSVVVTDAFNDALRTVDVATGVTATLLGGPGADDVDGSFDVAGIPFPTGVAVDAAGTTLWVASGGARAIKRVDLVARTVTTVASITDPWELALDEAAGALWVVASEPGTLSRLDLASGALDVVADGLAYPTGVAVADGAVFVAENAGHVLSRVAVDGAIDVVLGVRGFGGRVAGDAAVALLEGPSSLHAAVEDGVPVLYLAETAGQVVRRIDLRDRSSRFVVGSPTLSGALPAGARVALDEATLLNPLDVVTVGRDIIVVGDTTVVVARP